MSRRDASQRAPLAVVKFAIQVPSITPFVLCLASEATEALQQVFTWQTVRARQEFV